MVAGHFSGLVSEVEGLFTNGAMGFDFDMGIENFDAGRNPTRWETRGNGFAGFNSTLDLLVNWVHFEDKLALGSELLLEKLIRDGFEVESNTGREDEYRRDCVYRCQQACEVKCNNVNAPDLYDVSDSNLV
nr:hypothetical protein Iba_chr02aCG11550 [Ipomoea batatas]